MSSFVTRWLNYYCDLDNQSLTLHEIWILFLECLFVHAPKNPCFDTWPCKHQIPIHRSSVRFSIFNSKSCAWSFTSLGRVNTRMIRLLATSKSFTLSFIEYLDNSSLFFQKMKSEFYAIRILTAYTTKIKLHVPDELGILKHISKWARIINPWYSHVLSLHFLRMSNNHPFHLWNLC